MDSDYPHTGKRWRYYSDICGYGLARLVKWTVGVGHRRPICPVVRHWMLIAQKLSYTIVVSVTNNLSPKTATK